MKLNEHATFWLDSWVSTKTNGNEIARGHAKAIALHIASLQQHIQRLEAALDRQGTFHGVAVSMVRDLRLALLRGDYLMKQEMDARSDAWLKEVDGPHLTHSTHSHVGSPTVDRGETCLTCGRDMHDPIHSSTSTSEGHE
jgi:hypothetical protein